MSKENALGFITEIISQTIEHENCFQKLYTAFARCVPDQAEFWLGLASEEASHVKGVKQLEEYARQGILKMHYDSKLTPGRLQHSIQHLEMYLKEIDEHGVSQKRAVAIARELEESVIEKDFASAFESESEEATVIINMIHDESKEHCDGLEEFTVKEDEYNGLIGKSIVTRIQVEMARSLGQKSGRSLASILMSHFNVPKQAILDSYSEFFRLEAFSFDKEEEPSQDLVVGFEKQYSEMKHKLFVPVKSGDGHLEIALGNPHDVILKDEIMQMFLDKTIKFKVSIMDDVLAFVDALFENRAHNTELLGDIIGTLDTDAKTTAEMNDLAETEISEDSSALVKLVNMLVEDAYAQNASDIHIEPGIDSSVKIRYRIDGRLKSIAECPRSYRNAIASRVKIMAGLDITERRKAQSGKIRFRRWGKLNIELRVETYPTVSSGEDAVIRLLAAGIPKPLAELGLNAGNLKNVGEIITKPYGIFLCVGPTGSGKTTTLHSALSQINDCERKILTAEDPVEITQPGLRQIQMNPKAGVTFASTLRSFLRADPDVIMIGEMRDQETAAIGFEASLTGHLVFSTLHTNSAPETVTRLLDMGLDPYVFSDAILGILAQRLVLTLCPACRVPVDDSQAILDTLREEYGNDTLFDEVVKSITVSLNKSSSEGCDQCDRRGYHGRGAIHELLVADDKIRNSITNRASLSTLREEALQSGMHTLKQDGIDKIMQGLTTIKEVRAVCAR
ncbi:MAG: GspE/PulE family protein [Planctomycetota bacterium]|jgi:type II secretory ATPase GspE/PulE/Tfp pilus assembly ATPase PilB-like protein